MAGGGVPAARADFSPACQVILDSQPTICGTSGKATYKVSFTNLIPKTLLWRYVWTDEGGVEHLVEETENAPSLEEKIGFISTLNNLNSIYFYDVEQNDNNEYLVTGAKGHNSYQGGTDILVSKFDKYGNFVSAKNYRGPKDQFGLYTDEYGSIIIKTQDKGYAVFGSFYDRQSRKSNDIFFLKFAGDGTLAKVKIFGGSGNDQVYSAKQTQDGGYILSGAIDINNRDLNKRKVFILKLNGDGSISWSKTVPGLTFHSEVKQTSKLDYILATTINSDPALLKFDSVGNLSWARKTRSNSPSIGAEISYFTSELKDGNYLVGGMTNTVKTGRTDVWLFKYDQNGNYLSSTSWGYPKGSMINSLSYLNADSDGGYFISASISGNPNIEEQVISKFDNQDNLVWSKALKNGGVTSYKSPTKQTNDSGYLAVILLNQSMLGVNYYNYLLKLTQEGEIPGCEKFDSLLNNPQKKVWTPVVTDITGWAETVVDSSGSDFQVYSSSIDLFKVSDVSGTSSYQCQYTYVPPSEITQELSYPTTGHYTPSLTVTTEGGQEVECTSISDVLVTDEKTCSLTPYYEDDELVSRIDPSDPLSFYKVLAGQRVVAKTELTCVEPTSMSWNVLNGDMLSYTNNSLTSLFDVGGLAKIGATATETTTDPDTGLESATNVTCDEAQIQVKEKMRYGF
jgi:hypothetical protein